MKVDESSKVARRLSFVVLLPCPVLPPFFLPYRTPQLLNSTLSTTVRLLPSPNHHCFLTFCPPSPYSVQYSTLTMVLFILVAIAVAAEAVYTNGKDKKQRKRKSVSTSR
jgi:hypothetical protein